MIFRPSRRFLPLAAIVLTALGAALAAHTAAAAPRLEADSPHRDLGTVQEGIKARVTFTVTNTGDEEALIQRVESAEACTSTGLSTRRLKPGEDMEMEFIFETLGYSGTTARGATVHYNSPESPLDLEVSGTIKPAQKHQAPLGELSFNFFVLVDVRDPAAFREEHIVGAVNVPADSLMEWMEKVPKHVTVYLYDDTGRRSGRLARKLHRKDYSQVKSLIGGLEEWKKRKGDGTTISGKR